ncbi:DHO-dh domain-containing protein [Mycena indigotica]|uniref:Dihydroorotate oxidase n=1 Tax=Mycena indigotica TaxID=2126181 RepID=A0A8H6W9C5_9AGAR|nr:DHO-dh domain-containing protein [Mycena indigotica]KAF7306468.1 DHO-dh domain-containing protein [Mycena indigotica]
MIHIGSLELSTPLVNASCAWASDLQQLQALFDCDYTGAVITRTATLQGFTEDATHTAAFASQSLSSINSYGYSPHELAQYLLWIDTILSSAKTKKPFIISTTASDPKSMELAVSAIQSLRAKHPQVGIEFNTSCPNIQGSPPAGYTPRELVPLLSVLADAWALDPTLTIGLKLPPYVHAAQFIEVISVLRALCTLQPGSGGARSPIAYIACTNTLGNSLLFPDQVDESAASEFALPTGLGGLAGDALHPLALGNVHSFSKALASEGSNSGLRDLIIIGIGGVTSAAAAERMRKAGAHVVGSATLFGKEGIRAFEILAKNK